MIQHRITTYLYSDTIILYDKNEMRENFAVFADFQILYYYKLLVLSIVITVLMRS